MTKRFLFILTALIVFTLTFLNPETVKAAFTQQDIPFEQPNDEWESRPIGHCQNIDITRPCYAWEDENRFSPMMNPLIEAIATQTDLAIDEIRKMILDRLSLFEIASNAGMSSDSFYELHNTIREQVWQERQSNKGIWDSLPFSGQGRMFRIFEQRFNSETLNQKERGFGACQR